MKKLMPHARGFIPMMLCILGVVAAFIYLVYTRVASSGH